MKILLVSGNAEIFREMIPWLEALGAEVTVESNLRKVLSRIETDPDLDLAIMESSSQDICSRLLKSMRSSYRLQSFPVIMVGERFLEAEIAHYHELHVNDVLLLPTNRDTLQAKVHRALVDCRKSVLVVDDEPAILGVLSQFLRLERFRPLTAATAEDAINILQSDTVDLVVSDIFLPEKSGTQLLEFVKSSYPHIPVILITGYGGKCGPKEAIAMGADGYFSKPFNNVELIYALRSCLSRYAHHAKGRNDISAQLARK